MNLHDLDKVIISAEFKNLSFIENSSMGFCVCRVVVVAGVAVMWTLHQYVFTVETKIIVHTFCVFFLFKTVQLKPSRSDHKRLDDLNHPEKHPCRYVPFFLILHVVL